MCVCTCVYVLCRHMHATECTWWWEDDVCCHHVSGRAPCSLPQTSWPKASDCPLLCFYFHLTKAVGTVAVCCYICLHPDSGIYSSLWCYTESVLPAEPSPGLRCMYYSITRWAISRPQVQVLCGITRWVIAWPWVHVLCGKCVSHWAISRPCMPFYLSEMLNS